MTTENQRVPSVAVVARALRGPFIGDKLAEPHWALPGDVTDALPVLTLVCFGGPSEPRGPDGDPDRSELRQRLEHVRKCLTALAPRFKEVSNAELEEWLHEDDEPDSRKVWDNEGKRLEVAAKLIFQLESDNSSTEKGVLQKVANRLWRKTAPQSRWFERNREKFICEKFATWLVEKEKRHLASARKKPAKPTRKKPAKSSSTAKKPRSKQSGKKSPQRPHLDPKPTGAVSPPPPRRDGDSRESSRRAVPIIIIALVALIAIPVILGLFAPSVRLGKEIVQSSTSPEATLECKRGKTADYSFSPSRFPDNPQLVDPAALSVRVGRVGFWFESLVHRNRLPGFDSWDFNFESPDVAKFSFIFRSDQSSGGGFGYVVNGPPGSGQEPTNGVCALLDFHKSALGEFLKDRSNNEGFAWAVAAQG